MATKLRQLYEGKAKKVFECEDPTMCIVSYKDDATAFNGLKKGTIRGKGVINNRLTNYLMQKLEKEAGIPTHFVQELSDTDTLVKKVDIVPLEVIVRNVVAGSLSKRVGKEEGTSLLCPVLEFSYKDDELGDPMVNDYHIRAMGWCSDEALEKIKEYALRINDYLVSYFKTHGKLLIFLSTWPVTYYHKPGADSRITVMNYFKCPDKDIYAIFWRQSLYISYHETSVTVC